ncbi:polyketide cyclase [Lentzea sp. NPDC059081]|uniref:polyketide cyclase n=1 Tax=Lentzea sp. NPDC059081 TaxID=3346719 RepID=UPI0036C2E82F
MDQVSATLSFPAAAERVFAVLADPASHAAIDGTGWAQGVVDREPLTRAGQVFRMAMHHDGHPDGDYRTANRVEVLEEPSVIGWLTGYETDEGELVLGGWVWRYDLVRTGPETSEVTLTYDWSEVNEERRAIIGFPPFGPDHLGNSLRHLRELVISRTY